MGVEYESVPEGPFLQGELLADVWEHRSLEPTIELPIDGAHQYHSFHHPFVVLLDAGCDLETDFRKRGDFVTPREDEEIEKQDQDGGLLQYLTLCDVFEEGSIVDRMAGGDILRRTSNGNQEARYHFLPEGEGEVADREGLTTSLYLDFKRVISVPTSSLYEGVASGNIRRAAVIPPIYAYDLAQRFYSYRSRIGQP